MTEQERELLEEARVACAADIARLTEFIANAETALASAQAELTACTDRHVELCEVLDG